MAYNPDELLDMYPRYMHLQICVDGNPELFNRYASEIQTRNNKIFNIMEHIDAGFDLFVPHQTICYTPDYSNIRSNKIDFGIKCVATVRERNYVYNTGYYLHPRSSISKSPLRLANSTGIIDSGYRGNIIGMFDTMEQGYMVQQYDRIAQICAPSLMPIFVELVGFVNEETIRAGGGFGSTGR